MNIYLSLGKLECQDGKSVLFFFFKTVEELFQLDLVSVFFLYSFLFDVAREES